jgi:hypothetical protein
VTDGCPNEAGLQRQDVGGVVVFAINFTFLVFVVTQGWF